MEKDVVITLQHITKSYKLFRSRNERVKEWLLPGFGKRHLDHFALQDVSFSINKGEVIGLIGKNGSGKSTLLKILAGVVTPSKGSVSCKGNVTALLELGAGFSPDLTGVENIYYLGAIQGYGKEELDAKIDEILAFAEIGEYAWQPVKNYSSGMYVRLAFSLSIHIDPEILIIDEALSVGDVRFQQKCFRKIREFKDQGKTIIFCSHSMQAIRDFCTKVIWIHDGILKEIGLPDVVTEHYTLFMTTGHKEHPETKGNIADNVPSTDTLHQVSLPKYPWLNLKDAEHFGQGNVRIEAAAIHDENGESITFTPSGCIVNCSLLVRAQKNAPMCDIRISVQNALGSRVLQLSSQTFDHAIALLPDKLEFIQARFVLPDLPNGQYSISLGVQTLENEAWQTQHFMHDVLFFTLHVDDPRFNSSAAVVIRDATFVKQDL